MEISWLKKKLREEFIQLLKIIKSKYAAPSKNLHVICLQLWTNIDRRNNNLMGRNISFRFNSFSKYGATVEKNPNYFPYNTKSTHKNSQRILGDKVWLKYYAVIHRVLSILREIISAIAYKFSDALYGFLIED